MDTPEEVVQDLLNREKNEPISAFLGMKLEELKPGYSRVTMTVREEFLNFNNYIFGGIIMSLADQAFAYANNSVDFPSVASEVNIYYLAAPKVGDKLTGECQVLKSGKKSAVSEMTVKNSDGRLIAKATGITIPVGQR
ncbi:MAG: PaaI family thioesterase [Dehalococcoidales bacterium]|nr:PaaI family thioesterase [Dehalococcoidales bacterium]